MKSFLYDHVLSFVIIPLVIIVCFISYYRFMVRNDYVVGYEGKCNPAIEKCFVGCEDDACTKNNYYSKVQKYAPDLYKECGKDITDCENASKCLPGDRNCSIIHCDPTVEGDTCATSTVNIESTQEVEESGSTTDKILPDNTTDK